MTLILNSTKLISTIHSITLHRLHHRSSSFDSNSIRKESFSRLACLIFLVSFQIPFDLLGDDDNDDLSLFVRNVAAAPAKKAPPATAAGKTTAPPAKLPSKPLLTAQAAVREAKNEGGRGRQEYGRGGRGVGGFNRGSATNEDSFGNRAISGGQGGLF